MKTRPGSIAFARNLVLFLLLLLAGPVALLHAQESVVRVLDADTGEPCMYSNVVLTSMKGLYLEAGSTNDEGVFRFSVEEEARICVTYVGYKLWQDTIQPGTNLTIELRPESIEMEAVVVTGQHSPKPVDQSIYKIDVVGAKVMQERGVNNLAEALATETGLRLSLDPATGISVQMQGMSGENIKYLIDGVPIAGRVRGNIDLEQINMENIDHIEIVRGPMAVQYGTGAIAGVINIITKKNNYFRNLVKATTYVDHKNKYNFGLYGSMIRGRHTFTLSGNRSLFQGMDIDIIDGEINTGEHDRRMEYKPKLVYNADAEYAYKKEDFRLNLKSQFMNSLIKDYVNPSKGENSSGEISWLAYDTDYYTNRSTTSLSLSDALTEELSYNIIGAYTWFERHSHGITSDLHYLTHDITDTTRTVFNTLMTRGSLAWVPGAKLSLLGGWDFNFENGYGDKIEEGARIGDFAFFLSGQYSLLPRLSLQPGIRFIYNTKYGAPLIPSLSLHWNILDNLVYRLSYARGFRSPSIKELYMDFKDSNHDIFGNPDLKAETTNSFNTSLDYKLRGRKFSLKLEPSAFFNYGKDVIIISVLDGQTNTATYDNLGLQKTVGGEFNASLHLASSWSFRAGFSRIGESYDEEGGNDWTPYVFYNNYNLSANYTLPKIRTIFNMNFKYYGITPTLASLPEEQGGGIYLIYKDPYADLEATITQTFWKNRMTMVLGARNLLNYYAISTSGYQEGNEVQYSPLYYGRVFFVKLNLKLVK